MEPNWISVEVALPAKPGYYLVSDGEAVTISLFMCIHLAPDKMHWYLTREAKLFFTTVTHWMPKPKPPIHAAMRELKIDAG